MDRFTKDDYLKLIAELESLADLKYKAFHEKLIPGIENVLGVRSPMLKNFAKDIAKRDIKGYLETTKHKTYEEIMIHGFAIGFVKESIEKKLEYLDEFMPYITNWAVCDGTVANFKFKRNEEKEVYSFIHKYLKSDEEYKLRVGSVFLMDYFVKDEYIDDVLDYYNNITSEKYYVNMAVAWGISVCFFKFTEKTMVFLKNNKLDDFTYNKSLQKIIESNRVDKETKEVIKTMKRKKG